MSIYQRLGSIYQNENEKTDSKILRNINIKQTLFYDLLFQVIFMKL